MTSESTVGEHEDAAEGTLASEESATQAAEPADDVNAGSNNDDVDDDTDGHGDNEGGTNRLEEEGDIAADYLEELLDIADIDGDIDIEIRSGRNYLSIVTEDDSGTGQSSKDDALEALVGPDGAVLDALQELVRLAVLASTGNRSRLVLDINGYRVDRAGVLQKLAQDAVEKARETGDDVALDPMSAYERKIVHDAVAELGLTSESEGMGAARHIVVSL